MKAVANYRATLPTYHVSLRILVPGAWGTQDGLVDGAARRADATSGLVALWAPFLRAEPVPIRTVR